MWPFPKTASTFRNYTHSEPRFRALDILYLTLQKLAVDPRPGTHFLLSVHDELVLECPKEDARGVALWLKQKMREAMEDILGKELGGPRCAEVGYGPSWGECVEVEVMFQQYKEQLP